MSRLTALLAAGLATLALSAPPAASQDLSGIECLVGCSGTITGLPPGVARIQITFTLICDTSNRFHPVKIVRSTVSEEFAISPHGSVTFALTPPVPGCGNGHPVTFFGEFLLFVHGKVFGFNY